MDNKLIDTFIKTTLNVLETMALTKAHPGQPESKNSRHTWGDVTGLIGMAGENVSGVLIISFDEAAVLGIVNRMLSESYQSVTEEVVDAVGEITNMICGGAKAAMQENNFKFEMASPLMMTGKGTELKQLNNNEVVVIPFETEDGNFVIEAGLRKVKFD